VKVLCHSLQCNLSQSQILRFWCFCDANSWLLKSMTSEHLLKGFWASKNKSTFFFEILTENTMETCRNRNYVQLRSYKVLTESAAKRNHAYFLSNGFSFLRGILLYKFILGIIILFKIHLFIEMNLVC
jgi:hypothetical protein